MKVLVKFIVLLVVIAGVVLFIVGASLNAIVKTGMETMGTQMLGAPVSVQEVDISLLSDGGHIQGDVKHLIIKNPPGFYTEQVFKVPVIHIRLNRDSVLTKTVLVDEILIEHPEITVEVSSRGSNLTTIQERIEELSKEEREPESPTTSREEERADQEGKRVEIHQVIIKEPIVNLSITALKGQVVRLPLSDITLRDIGKQSGGASFQEAGAEIFSAINVNINNAVSESGKLVGLGKGKIQEHVEELGKGAEKLGKNLLKGLLNQ